MRQNKCHKKEWNTILKYFKKNKNSQIKVSFINLLLSYLQWKDFDEK